MVVVVVEVVVAILVLGTAKDEGEEGFAFMEVGDGTVDLVDDIPCSD